MKKLLLVSMFQNVSHILKSIDPNLKGKTVTFIPTASKAERFGFFVNIGKWKLKNLGLSVDTLDISTASLQTVQKTLEKNDYIYVSGGNTFFLLQELRRTGADQILVKEVNAGKLYIGESAGAIIAAPDISYSSAMDNMEKAPALKDYAGFHLIDFYVVPHAGHWEFKKAVQTIVQDYSQSLNLRVINDHQAIFVDGGEVTLLPQ